MAKFIGIDLGTSNSAAAVMEGGRPVIIPSAEGAGVASGKAFPSFVAFTKDGQLLVGEVGHGRHHRRRPRLEAALARLGPCVGCQVVRRRHGSPQVGVV